MIYYYHEDFDWFTKDCYDGNAQYRPEFKYVKINQQTENDHTFFSGDLKLDYTNSKNRNERIKKL